MMEIRKIKNGKEWFESEKLIATAFLHDWNEEEMLEKSKKWGIETSEAPEETWCVLDESDSKSKMMAAVAVGRNKYMLGGQVITGGELHMVGSLPEFRGKGNIRTVIHTILEDFKDRGDDLAVLIPFSFPFYRKFGFELISKVLEQEAPISSFQNFCCNYDVEQVVSEEQIPVLKKLYDAFIKNRNMSVVRTSSAWAYRGNGEFGAPDFFHSDRHPYTYIFYNHDGNPSGYLKFIFVHGPEGPFTGKMHVQEMIYDSPETFRQILGYIYRFQAKITHVKVSLMDDLDLAVILPECDQIERKIEGHMMGRILNVESFMSHLSCPGDNFSVHIYIDDCFLSENTGIYQIDIENGKVSARKVSDHEEVDFCVKMDTFTQLAVGRIDLETALYRDGSVLKNKKEQLKRLFTGKTVCL